MVVTYEGRFWEIDMSFNLFTRMKRRYPDTMVTLIEVSPSTYKEKKRARLGDLK